MTLTNEAVLKVLDTCVAELIEAGKIRKSGTIVLGCSTSEVAGGRIGKASVPELGEILASAMLRACENHGVHACFQCCEHLNRAIVTERAVAERLGLTQVCAVPKPKAGGSVPAAAWLKMRDPVLVMAIRADAAIDVGDTLVGMHISPVAVPLRGSCDMLGDARIVMAYSRLPLIGGSRAMYE